MKCPHNFNKTNTRVLSIVDDGDGNPIVIVRCGFCKKSWRCYPIHMVLKKK